MKTPSVFKFFFCSYLILYAQGLHVNSVVCKAINSILSEHFVNRSETLDLISYGIKGGASEKIINEISLNINDGVAVRVRSSENWLSRSSVLAFDSIQNFVVSTKHIMWQTKMKKRFQHLVHIPKATLADIESCISDFNGFSIDNVNFLVEGKELDLSTVYMLTDTHCRRKQLKIINRFIKDKNSWEGSEFYPNKYRNFHNCELKMATFESKWISGTEIASMIFEGLAGQFNYQLQRVVLSPATFQSVLQIAEPFYAYDFLDLERLLSVSTNKIYALSVVIHVEKHALTVPPGESFTPLEKIFLPFQDAVWIGIMITLLIGFLTIQVINLCPEHVKRFVFGAFVRTPTMNLIEIFLTGAQSKLPGTNFARFLVTLFIIWSLIIRTCHQSELFKYLQQDLRKPTIKSVQELIEKNFTYYHPDGRGLHIIKDPAYAKLEAAIILTTFQ